jgi:hypothetical protein
MHVDGTHTTTLGDLKFSDKINGNRLWALGVGGVRTTFHERTQRVYDPRTRVQIHAVLVDGVVSIKGEQRYFVFHLVYLRDVEHLTHLCVLQRHSVTVAAARCTG